LLPLQRHTNFLYRLHSYRYLRHYKIVMIKSLLVPRQPKNCIGCIITVTEGEAATGAEAAGAAGAGCHRSRHLISSSHGRSWCRSSKQGRRSSHRRSSHGSRSHARLCRSSSRRSSSLRNSSHESHHRSSSYIAGFWGCSNHGSSRHRSSHKGVLFTRAAATGGAATEAAGMGATSEPQRPGAASARALSCKTVIPRNPMTVSLLAKIYLKQNVSVTRYH
jgi:hypothetical protein